MKITAVFVRLFKAFNYDYIRLHDPRVIPDPWDYYGGVHYPYVRIPLDDEITCVVGANESGKSQLLDAMRFALGVGTPGAADSCRYSKFFGEKKSLGIAQFGLTLGHLAPTERTALSAVFDENEVRAEINEVHVFRESPGRVRVFIGDKTAEIADTEELRACLPQTFSIDPTEELADSVPISYLIGRATGIRTAGPRRVDRLVFIDRLLGTYDELQAALAGSNPLGDTLKGLLPRGAPNAKGKHLRQFEIAYDMLATVGGIDPGMFQELHNALRRESEGLTTAILAKMNQQLSKALNLHRWWSQDTQFDLQVDTRDFDLVFTIRDRTASEYSFAERSSGLKFFLSYLVQYLTHLKQERPAAVLIMDEPDAYLSHQGQHDLLRLFQDFIDRDRQAPRQVVFVTHSPFLIDRNRAERVRVLDKGVDDEGSRVVKNASHNHFEPLRSAFGGFVGETTFIGNCNLLMEGQTDQIYIAGLTSDAQRRDTLPTERLDLNEVTLVFAGGAQHVPYMTYLARGRDYDKPAVVVLLDGDDEGDEAAAALKRGFRNKEVISPKFVIQITAARLPEIQTERAGGPIDIEDLVPLGVLLIAASDMSAELVGSGEPVPTIANVRAELTGKYGHYAALAAAFASVGSTLRVDKVGLARHVIDLLDRADSVEGVDDLRENFRHLFRELYELKRIAERERTHQTVSLRVNREIDAFLKHHPDRSTRDELRVLLLDVERLLDESVEADKIRVRKLALERTLRLTSDLAEDVARYEDVVHQLRSLRYAAAMNYEDDAITPAEGTGRYPSEGARAEPVDEPEGIS